MRKIQFLLLCAVIIVCMMGCAQKQPSGNQEQGKDPVKKESVKAETQTEQETLSEITLQEEKESEVTWNAPLNHNQDVEKKTTDTGREKRQDKQKEEEKEEQISKQPEPSVAITQTQENPKVPNATKEDCEKIADRVIWYINSYRSSPATKLSGLTEYAKYRSRQLIGNFAHDTKDERAAATTLQYGTYVDTVLYGMEGEPYYESGAREAIAKGGYVGSVNEVAKRLANLVKNSAGHWSYVGSSEYSYIAVGITYESGMWYCDIAMARVNTDHNENNES